MDDKNYTSAINDMYTRIDELEHTIYKGGDKPSIILQISELQHQIATMNDAFNTRIELLNDTIRNKFDYINNFIVKLDNKIEDIKTTSEQAKQQDRTNKTSIIVAVIACAGAILSNIVSFLLIK